MPKTSEIAVYYGFTAATAVLMGLTTGLAFALAVSMFVALVIGLSLAREVWLRCDS